jgi:hypothetical protein
MKRSLKTSLLLPFALTGPMLIAQQPQRQQQQEQQREQQQRQQQAAEDQAQQESQQQTITGKVAKSNRGKYVLVDSTNMMYQLDDQSTAKKFAGKKVKVSGTVDTSSNTIHVTDIKPAS